MSKTTIPILVAFFLSFISFFVSPTPVSADTCQIIDSGSLAWERLGSPTDVCSTQREITQNCQTVIGMQAGQLTGNFCCQAINSNNYCSATVGDHPNNAPQGYQVPYTWSCCTPAGTPIPTSTPTPTTPNCITSDCNGVNCAATGRVCTITTNPCSCVVPTTPTATPAPTSTPAPITCTPTTSYPQCGQTGGCTNNYAANHTVQITPSNCSNGTTTYACSDLGTFAGQCGNPNPPSTPSFTGASANGSAACYKAEYTATVAWTGTALPASDSACPNGFWVDISTDSNFGSYFHKCVNGTTTSAPDGFTGLTFLQDTIYYARIFNNSPTNFGHSPNTTLSVPSTICPDAAVCTLTKGACTQVPNGTECPFTSTYTINGSPATPSLQTLTPDINSPSFTSSSLPLSWIYQPGTYTAKLDASNNTSSASCVTPSFTIPPPVVLPSSCNISVGPISRNITTDTYNSPVNVSYQTTSLNTGSIWFCPTGTNCTPNDWTRMTDFNNPYDGPWNFSSWNPNGFCSVAGNTTNSVVVADPNGNIVCNTTVSCPPPGATPPPSCTLTASPACNPTQCSSPTTTHLTATVDTTGMPDSKLSSWDCNGNGTWTTDTSDTHNCTYSSNGAYTPAFRVVDGAKNPGDVGYILANPCYSLPLGIGTAPPPPSNSCSMSISPNPQSPGGQIGITFTSGPSGNYKLTCPDGSTRGPGDKNASWLCSTPNSPGTYSVTASGPNNISCSANVTLASSSSQLCSVVSSTGSVAAYAFVDPNSDPISPADIYSWDPTGNDCDSGGDGDAGNIRLVQIKQFLQNILAWKVSAVASCNNPSANTASCCGLKDISDLTCSQGRCITGPAPYPYVNSITLPAPSSVNSTPVAVGIPGITVHVNSNLCHFRYNADTNQNGVAVFNNLPVTVGTGHNTTTVGYNVSIDPPANLPFSRGTCFYGSGAGTFKVAPVNSAPSLSCSQTYTPNGYSFFSSFGFSSSTPLSPWIQTRGGDVHSNTKINTPGGP